MLIARPREERTIVPHAAAIMIFIIFPPTLVYRAIKLNYHRLLFNSRHYHVIARLAPDFFALSPSTRMTPSNSPKKRPSFFTSQGSFLPSVPIQTVQRCSCGLLIDSRGFILVDIAIATAQC